MNNDKTKDNNENQSMSFAGQFNMQSAALYLGLQVTVEYVWPGLVHLVPNFLLSEVEDWVRVHTAEVVAIPVEGFRMVKQRQPQPVVESLLMSPFWFELL